MTIKRLDKRSLLIEGTRINLAHVRKLENAGYTVHVRIK